MINIKICNNVNIKLIIVTSICCIMIIKILILIYNIYCEFIIVNPSSGYDLRNPAYKKLTDSEKNQNLFLFLHYYSIFLQNPFPFLNGPQ